MDGGKASAMAQEGKVLGALRAWLPKFHTQDPHGVRQNRLPPAVL